MGRHSRARNARIHSRPSRRRTALRAVTVAVAFAVCVVGSIKLFSSATSAADNVHAASLGGAHNARLHPPGGVAKRQHRRHHVRKPSPSPSPTPSVRQHISGSEVTAVGDSVLVASTPAIDHVLPGIAINAVVGRQFSTGLQVIASLKASGQLRPIVVMALGTNGTVTTQEISQLYAEIGPSRRLVLVSTYEARSWEQEVNSTLATAVADHPQTTVMANWFTAIEHRTDLLWPDGIHPQPAGGVVYAHLLKRALNKLVNLPGA